MEEVKKTEDLIVIDDGRIDVPIRNQFGEQMGVFRFNPTDINIVNRYNKAMERIDGILEPLSNMEEDDDKAIDALNDAEEKVVELLDYILDGDARNAFFQKLHAFALVNGKFFCEVVLEAIGAFISRKFESETVKLRQHVSKYTSKYDSGKRSKG